MIEPTKHENQPQPPQYDWTADAALLHDSSAGLLGSLDLTEQAPDVFEGRHQRIPSGRAYGGEVVGQAVEAVTRTVDSERPIHSLHGYFLRAAAVTQPTTWEVERLRDGRTVSSRAVRGHQDGRVIFQGLASFQTVGEGAEHAVPMPTEIGRAHV